MARLNICERALGASLAAQAAAGEISGPQYVTNAAQPTYSAARRCAFGAAAPRPVQPRALGRWTLT
jgi:hypothetical protein